MEKTDKKCSVVLSQRLTALTRMVTPGSTVADVGCDHGFVPIYLVQNGIAPHVVAMDLRKGPLAGANEHIASCGLSAYIETRLSDGLTAFVPGEAKTLICAGMGGRLMQQILAQYPEKTASFRELILQPQSVLWEFRVFLRESGINVVDEDILCEDGKYYFLMKAVPSGMAPEETEVNLQRLYDKYGRFLLERKHPVLQKYLEKELQNCLKVEEKLLERERLDGFTKKRAESLAQTRQEIADLRRALDFWRE